ncbi:MAG: hypothetical protein COW84_10230 [Gammaproteobacteria bacterium CG22_combo_CG10-13_8_21_14_all_40_8]|nr:MAG: hypothetical protein COW84_10230 [Gammaproteobacteria bacterium CG22_combo_CG10-13_8_21_14_all_40_8]
MRSDSNQSEKDVVWTQSMPERKKQQTQDWEAHPEEDIRGQVVPDLDLRTVEERLKEVTQRKKLIITGRAQNVKSKQGGK